MYKQDFYIVYSKFAGSQDGIYSGFKINFVQMKTSLSGVQLLKICPMVHQKTLNSYFIVLQNIIAYLYNCVDIIFCLYLICLL